MENNFEVHYIKDGQPYVLRGSLDQLIDSLQGFKHKRDKLIENDICPDCSQMLERHGVSLNEDWSISPDRFIGKVIWKCPNCGTKYGKMIK